MQTSVTSAQTGTSDSVVAAALRFDAASLLQVLSYSIVELAAAADADNLCLVSSIFRQKAFEFCKLRATVFEK